MMAITTNNSTKVKAIRLRLIGDERAIWITSTRTLLGTLRQGEMNQRGKSAFEHLTKGQQPKNVRTTINPTLMPDSRNRFSDFLAVLGCANPFWHEYEN
jgi:hypothetical protein